MGPSLRVIDFPGFLKNFNIFDLSETWFFNFEPDKYYCIARFPPFCKGIDS